MASGDKFYIADKATLDEVKGKIGTTNDAGSGSTSTGSVFAKLNYIVAQLGSYLSGIYNFVSRIGATNDTQSSSTTTGSVFAKLNYLVSQVSSYLSSVYNNCLKIGITTDTGGSLTAGTVMAKLNAIFAYATKIEANQKISYKQIEVTIPGNSAMFTALDILGGGVLIAVKANWGAGCINEISATWDSSQQANGATNDASVSYQIIKPAILSSGATSRMCFFDDISSTIDSKRWLDKLSFKESLVIKLTNVSSSATVVSLLIGLYV